MPSETNREVAERLSQFDLAAFYNDGDAVQTQLANDIEAALDARDRRAAMICKTAAVLASPDGVIPAGDPENERLQSLAAVLNKAAAAIRGSKD